MKEKIKSGILHCANYTCKNCPYAIPEEEWLNFPNSANNYVRCMQTLIEDIYEIMKEVEE